MIDREKIVDELFALAVDLPSAERQELFAECSAADSSLSSEGVLDEVMELLDDYNRAEAGGFLRQPLITAEGDEPVHSLQVGQQLEGYKILGLIDEGGMGEVYLAEDTELGRQVAIKLIKSHLKTRELLRRFFNERQILANLRHSNIGQLLEAGATANGLPFFVMEYVEGQHIDKYADDHKLSITERLKLFRTVCSAVSYAHQHLVIHRDIKPSNILVTGDGEPKLLDFGIAKLLQSSALQKPDATATRFQVMTAEYASPEQVKGEPITTATDVYSLGVLLYELLTGRRPYRLKHWTTSELAKAVCEQEPERPSTAISRVEETAETNSQITAARVSETREGEPERLRRRLRGDIDNIVLMAMRKDPLRRYTSVGQLSEDIARHLDGLPVIARTDTFTYRASKFIKRNKIAVAAAAVILIVLIGGIIATAWEAHVARAERANAEERFNDVRHLAHSVLFDYHDEIAALPGSTHVRERLVQDALQYLDRLSQKAGNDVSLRRELATAYVKVGDVQGRAYGSNLGHTDQALVSYQKALAILEQLSPHNSSDKELQYDLATAYERIGSLQLRKQNWVAAQSENEKALAIWEGLLAGDPQKVNYQRRVANCYLFVGDAMQAQCTDAECLFRALDVQRKGLAILETLARGTPSDLDLLREASMAYDRVAFRLSAIGQLTHERAYFQQALESRQSAVAILEQIVAAAPTNALYRRALADQYMTRGDTQIQNDQLAEGLNGYRRALTIFQALSSIDSANAEALRDLSYVHYKLAAGLLKANDHALARAHYNQVLAIDDQLQAADPANPEDLQTAAAVYLALSDLSVKEGNLDEAISDYRKVVDYYESRRRIASNAQTLSPASLGDSYLNVANLYTNLARLYAKAGTLNNLNTSQRVERLRAAKAWYEKTMDLHRELIAKGIPGVDYAWQKASDESAKIDQALSKYAK
jgi:serine/threonine protein kinase